MSLLETHIATLRYQRQRLGLSLADVAERLDTTKSSVNKWERGESIPSSPMLLRWTHVLDCADVLESTGWAVKAAGPNDRLRCGTSSARRRHLTHGHGCTTCGIDGKPEPKWRPRLFEPRYRPLATVTPLHRDPLDAAILRHPAGKALP